MITVAPVRGRRARRQFINLPYAMYRNTPWVPPLRLAEHARFSPRHPFFAHAAIELFLAYDGSNIVGRVAAIDDRLHNETHHDNLAAFGHFEAETEDAARALLAAAEAWARQRGRDRVRGPLDSSLNEMAGLLVDAFDAAPMVMMPYNPPEYAGFIERAGYTKVKDLFAWIVDLPGATVHERLAKTIARVRARHNITFRSVDMSAFTAEIERFVDIYCRAWHDNWAFVEPTRAEVRQLATELRYVVDRDLVVAAEVDGRMVGCGIALPDLNQALAGTSGRLFPLGLFRLLARRRFVTQARVALLGVLPEWRATGLSLLLFTDLLSRASRLYTRTELSWILEDNEAANGTIASLGGRHYKTYRVYQKELG